MLPVALLKEALPLPGLVSTSLPPPQERPPLRTLSHDNGRGGSAAEPAHTAVADLLRSSRRGSASAGVGLV